MFGQTFALFDLGRVAFLGCLEILLSADNAIVLGLIGRSLPEAQRARALFIGLISTIALRAAALFAAFHLLQFLWIQLLGAGYLIYLSAAYFFKNSHSPLSFLQKRRSFWATVFLIEIFDLMFALDSLLAAVAFIGPIPSGASIHPKLWIVYVGIAIGLLAIRFAAVGFNKLMTRFPRLETAAHLIIGWIGIKLGWTAIAQIFTLPQGHGAEIESIFWGGLALLFAFGLLKKHG